MSNGAHDAEAFMASAALIQQRYPGITLLQAGLLAAIQLDIAHDSRSFARMFGVEHALVLRALSALVEQGGFIRITKRDARTLRTHYILIDDIGSETSP